VLARISIDFVRRDRWHVALWIGKADVLSRHRDKDFLDATTVQAADYGSDAAPKCPLNAQI
jgi:hypothetical protein